VAGLVHDDVVVVLLARQLDRLRQGQDALGPRLGRALLEGRRSARQRLELARQLKRLQDKQSAMRSRGVPSRPRPRRPGVQE